MVQLDHTVLVFDVLKGTAEPSNVTSCHLNVALTKKRTRRGKICPALYNFEAIKGGGVNRPGALKENWNIFAWGSVGRGWGKFLDSLEAPAQIVHTFLDEVMCQHFYRLTAPDREFKLTLSNTYDEVIQNRTKTS